MFNKLYWYSRVVFSLLLCAMVPVTALASVTPAPFQPSTIKAPAIETVQKSIKSNYPLFFVTDRNAESHNGTIHFGDKRSESLTFGEYLRDSHSSELSDNKMTLFKSEQEFLDAVKATGSKDLAVLVHGYKESFNDSVERGLEMVPHLNAPLMVYAWPSKNNYCYYMDDECVAEWSAPHLARVLGDLGDTIGLHNITLVGHSLGARLVQWSLKNLYLERRPSDHFAALLLFSPDIDRDTLLQDAPFLKQISNKCRVYLDHHDTRIWLSKMLHGNPRVCASDKNDPQMKLSKIFNYDVSLHGHNSIPAELVADAMSKMVLSEKGN